MDTEVPFCQFRRRTRNVLKQFNSFKINDIVILNYAIFIKYGLLGAVFEFVPEKWTHNVLKRFNSFIINDIAFYD